MDRKVRGGQVSTVSGWRKKKARRGKTNARPPLFEVRLIGDCDLRDDIPPKRPSFLPARDSYSQPHEHAVKLARVSGRELPNKADLRNILQNRGNTFKFSASINDEPILTLDVAA